MTLVTDARTLAGMTQNIKHDPEGHYVHLDRVQGLNINEIRGIAYAAQIN